MSSTYKKFTLPAIGSLLLAGLLALNSFTKSDNKISDETALVIGLQSGYPPFEMYNSEGVLVGYDVDLGKALAAKLGKKPHFHDMEFEGEIISLKQGKIDLIMSGMNITSDRLKQIAMVPYLDDQSSALTLIFWKAIPQGVTTLEDLKSIPDAHVSVELGAVPELFLQKHYPSQPIRSFDSALSSLMDVKFGKSLANLVETDVAAYLQQQHSEIKTITVPLTAEDEIHGFGIGINKNNPELIAQIDQAIQEMKDSGELQMLQDKWFKEKSNGN